MKSILESIRNKMRQEWPIVSIKENFEPNFIFLLTPPNSGSTAISQVFVNSPNVDQIQNNSEGQWLIKGMCSANRWTKDKYINEKSVRSVWLNQCVKKLQSNGTTYFIEKSPPNMMRIELLQSIFPNHILLSNNRDPYANISSMFYRYTKDIDKISKDERAGFIANFAKSWVSRSATLKDLIIKQNIPYLSYEEFCENPTQLQNLLDQSIFREGIKLNFDSKLKVKNYKPQPIVNFNKNQIEKLTDADIKVISELLKNNEQLLSFFNYRLI